MVPIVIKTDINRKCPTFFHVVLKLTSCVSGQGNKIGPVRVSLCVCLSVHVSALSVCYVFVCVSQSITTKGLWGKRTVHWGHAGGT